MSSITGGRGRLITESTTRRRRTSTTSTHCSTAGSRAAVALGQTASCARRGPVAPSLLNRGEGSGCSWTPKRVRLGRGRRRGPWRRQTSSSFRSPRRAACNTCTARGARNRSKSPTARYRAVGRRRASRESFVRGLTSGLRRWVQGERMDDARFRPHRPVLTQKTSTVRLARGRPARRQGQFAVRKASGCLAPAVPRKEAGGRACIASLIPSKPRLLRFETPSFGRGQS